MLEPVSGRPHDEEDDLDEHCCQPLEGEQGRSAHATDTTSVLVHLIERLCNSIRPTQWSILYSAELVLHVIKFIQGLK